jgi:hypothetical protein
MVNRDKEEMITLPSTCLNILILKIFISKILKLDTIPYRLV